MNIDLSLIIGGLFASLLSHGQSKSFDYAIDGRIPGMASGKIYFSVFAGFEKIDSAEIKNETFHFKGTFPEPSCATLHLERNYVNKPLFNLFLDKGQHMVTLNKNDLRNSRVRGSATTKDYELLKSIEKPFDEQFRSISRLRSDTSVTAQQQYEKTRVSILKAKTEAQLAFIKAHPSSPVAAWAAHRYFISNPELEKVYNLLSPSLHYTSYAVEMKEQVGKNNMLSIGKIAPNFTQNDTLGKPVSLTDFRGKYVLVDFWASWCGPCRKDNPNVVRAFNTYKDKGFTVLSVSLDQPGKKDAWLKAIHDDGLTWTHVSDLKFWNNAVAKQYGINAVPTNLLIGPDGKILAYNLHGDKLQKALQELLK